MKELKVNFWEVWEDYDAIVCPTNQVVKINGALVMGGGLAKEFAERFPSLPFEWGKKHKEATLPDILFTKLPKVKPYLVAFPTKQHWRQVSSLELIKRSMIALNGYVDALEIKRVLLPRIGCGLGGLTWGQVSQIIEPYLDDRYTIISK